MPRDLVYHTCTLNVNTSTQVVRSRTEKSLVAVATALMYGKKRSCDLLLRQCRTALATYAARTGLYALVLVPMRPRAKLAQIARHGALLWAVEGASISAERYLARAAAVRHIAQWQDWVPMITASLWNPFAIEE